MVDVTDAIHTFLLTSSRTTKQAFIISRYAQHTRGDEKGEGSIVCETLYKLMSHTGDCHRMIHMSAFRHIEVN